MAIKHIKHKVKTFNLKHSHMALIALIVIIAILAAVMLTAKPTAKIEEPELPVIPPVTEPIACTADAKLCPGGSSVGRNASRNCEFNDCPALPAEVPETPATIEKTLNYTYPSGFAPPSLKITSFINTPTFPKVGETDLIRVYVKNVGSDSEATTAALKINDQVVATLDVPALERNAEIVLSYDWLASAVGDYTIEVNIAAVPGEEVFDDNYGKITTTVY